MKNNFIAHTGGPAGSYSEIQISPTKITVSGSPQYGIMILYAANKWMFIGGELTLNIDGRVVRHRIEPALTHRNVESGATVSEMCVCLVKRADIEAIANASRVMAQVGGQNGVMFLTFSPANIAAFKQFLASS